MALPKYTVVASLEDARDIALILARPVLVKFGEQYMRVHPSGKSEDLTAKFARVKELLEGSHPLKQGDIYASSANEPRKKS